VIGDAICRCRVCLLVRLIGVAGEATLAANIDASRVCCCAVSSRQDGPHRTSEKCPGADITRQPQQNALRIALALTVSPISKEHQVRANLQRAAIVSRVPATISSTLAGGTLSPALLLAPIDRRVRTGRAVGVVFIALSPPRWSSAQPGSFERSRNPRYESGADRCCPSSCRR
jgi:hypothetical protein